MEVIGKSSRSQEPFSAMNTRYDGTYTFARG